MKKPFYLIALCLSMFIVSSCGDDAKEDKDSAEDKNKKEQPKDDSEDVDPTDIIPSGQLTMCDCLEKSIEIMKEVGGDISSINKEDYPELKDCERFDKKDDKENMAEAMKMMQECPELVMKMQTVMQDVNMDDIQDQLEGLSDESPELKEALKDLENATK